MKKIVEKSLEAALIKASVELDCSVADLEYEVVQNSSNGFLGLGKKDAIIVIDTKQYRENKNEIKPRAHGAKNIAKENFIKTNNTQESHQDLNKVNEDDFKDYSKDFLGEQNAFESDEANVMQIRSEIESLFSLTPFDINHFDVRLEDNNTLFVHIDGPDCALLIGERGYRYNALSYLLFNWINPKYGYLLRLEIAQFLMNQEKMIDVYLKDIVQLVRLNGKAQTKVLDGVLVYIALNKLREIFPDKHVCVRQNEANEKYIAINNFRR